MGQNEPQFSLTERFYNVAEGPDLSRFVVGGQVTANDNAYLVKPGAKGRIVQIHKPNTGGRTTDVIEVQFADEKDTVFMKPKELNT